MNVPSRIALVTGATRGIGLETVRQLSAGGVHTLLAGRDPARTAAAAAVLQADGLAVEPVTLDVTDPASIRDAVAAAGPLDALVNNAGLGVAAPLEATPMATAREVFETNLFGAIALTQAVLPQFRQRKAGVIVNVSSSVTLRALPLVGVYSASKAAMNAFTESMALELQPFGLRAHLVLPGRAPETRFAENGASRLHGLDHPAYADLVQAFRTRVSQPGPITHSQDVAEAVWRAVTDPASPLKIPAGADAEALAAAR